MNAQDISASRHKRDEQVDLSHITHWQCLVKHTSISIHNRAVTRGYHKYRCFNCVANRAFSNSCICLLVHLYLSSIICQYVILHHLMSIVLLTITHLCLNHLLFIWLYHQSISVISLLSIYIDTNKNMTYYRKTEPAAWLQWFLPSAHETSTDAPFFP